MILRKHSRSPLFSALLLFLTLALVAAACSGGDDETAGTTTTTAPTSETTASPDATTTTAPPATTTTAPAELVDIQYATSFGLFGRDAYAHVALEKGYFEEAGFNVEILPGTGSGGNTSLVAAGQLDFAPADFTTMVLAKANEDVPVKMYSLVHFNALSCIFVREDSGITVPKDLEGITVAEVLGSVGSVLLPLYAERAGFDVSTIDLVNTDPPSMPGLMASGQVDGVGQFIVGVPLFENVTGGPIKPFCYADEIPELPGVGIVAREDRDPDEIRRFIQALNRGLADALANPQEAAEILQKSLPETDVALAAAELERMAPFVINDETDQFGIGYSDPVRLQAALDIIAANFEMGRAVTLDEVWELLN